MLLFLSQEHDAHCDWVEAECERRGVEYLRLCTERFPQEIRLAIEPASAELRGRLVADGREVSFDEIVGVWLRRPGAVTLNPEIPEGLREFSRTESEDALRGLFRALYDRRWVSPHHKVAVAGYKVHQLRLAAELGFKVSQTLVTNDPSSVTPFYQRCERGMIYKPLRFVPITDDTGGEFGIYTSLVTDEDLEQCLDSVQLAPCLFQEVIPKAYELRINVIGDRVWTAAVYSQESEDTALDCRHDLEGCRHAPVFLPGEIERKCLEMTRHFGLRMSNIDFIVTPDGEYYFLELNPNGQWAWIEELTGMPLCAALVDELLGVDTLAEHPYVRDRSLDFEGSQAYREASS